MNGSLLVAKNGQIIFEKYEGMAILGRKDQLRLQLHSISPQLVKSLLQLLF
jgi:hypothetical protein